jgi:DNA polymerase (family 10)
VEVDILPDGTLDLPEELLARMDLVVASMHVQLDQPREIATARLIHAIENPYVNIIGHPGGRIYPMLDVIDLDWERVYRAAAYNQVALEINSHKSHPIFDDKKARAAADLGVHIALNSDSHNTSMMANSRFGIALARRANLKNDQVINTWSIRHLKLWLRQKRA